MHLLEQLSSWLVDFVHALGYWGIFLMTFMESTFVPIPSEATMIPVGYLIHQGHMNFWVAFAASVVGTLSGSYFNYWVAKHYGRRFLLAYGKYMFLPPDKVAWLDKYFASHGQISILTGRLIPGVRHVISFPAGLAHMDARKFCLYTTIGGAVWMLVLIFIGYEIGDNHELVKHYVRNTTFIVLSLVATVLFVYIVKHRRAKKTEEA